MHTSNESNQEEDKAKLQQMGLQRNLCGNFLTFNCNGSTISHLLKKTIKIRKAVMDGLSYPPSAIVSSVTMADPSKEDHTGDPTKASMTEPPSLMNHPPAMASPDVDRLLKQFHHAKRARVENIIQGMSSLPKARLPREGGRSDGGTRDGGKIFQAWKRKGSLPKKHSHRLGGTCCGKREEFRKLREQLWATQRFLEELQQQQGFLQGCQASSSQARDREKGETGSPEWDNSKRDTQPPEGSNGKPCMHQDKEHEGGFSKDKIDGGQIPQEDDSHLMLNKGHKNLLETLKQELSQAVSKSVDLVFENLSPTLFYQSHQANVRPVLFASYIKPRKNVLIPRPPKLSLGKEERLPVELQKKSKVPLTEDQTEAESFVISNSPLIPRPSVNQKAKRPYHSLQAPAQLNQQNSLQEEQILEPFMYAPCDNLASLPCKSQAVSQDSITRNHFKVKPKVNSTYMDHQAHPVAVGPEGVGTLCHSHTFMSRDLQAVMERNFFMAVNIQEGLTPNHLKKAKLIFFYCRYPNSNVLKTFFPDIQFNRCITSQLIKWFSNFREFYYIHIEKFCRQFIADGVSSASDLSVTRDSELFRALNMHFNKGNDFQVPSRFLEVAEITLREFFNAISLAKDLDPSWKKAIYKVICKLDSDVPEVFKSTICW
ncbi:prospero homeobox protein 1-like [Anguilla anguilla]|uniref:prospero homeobox protein 1-like n=1 Tax=Anguilla anguilla TaxID=7936 RepID=UPI0015AC5D71|nr:prospero homeobox protein 1-like [Anguilla anguilla]